MDSPSSCSTTSTELACIERNDWPWNKPSRIVLQQPFASRNPFRQEPRANVAYDLLDAIPTRFEIHHERELHGLNNQAAVRSLVAALTLALRARTLHGSLAMRDLEGWQSLRTRDDQDAVLELVKGIFQSRGWQPILQVGKSPSAPPPVLALRGQRTKRRESVDKMLKGFKLKPKRRNREATWTAKDLLLAERASTPLFFDFSTS
ncbi:hypothetical protein BCR37DRAFT_393069 [Protomyces lactucae-debilis]|uniref:Uncharacterized protein n=1 Tax=Protomyces lactucae-debilis TaxID=2754530 RepID=A0A1Y2FGT5_PROLT|nr:uncharacterized protein BCR37DRAFT_393069 [Protomyces lactucae-debilis]ORY82025.1 hypothetical protein BCR37DRAFT_393069 [Protomyces lactucae-debilis]